MRRLITGEDPYGVHKVLGAASLVNYGYRIGVTRSFDLGVETAVFLGIHAVLSLSSMQFTILTTKNPSRPMIWPEFRLHSIAFALRAFAAVVVMWTVPAGPLQDLWRLVVVVAVSLFSDAVTGHYKAAGALKSTDSTMRTLMYPATWSPEAVRQLKYFYSVSQMIGTSAVLVADDPYVVFVVAFPVQLAAFLMTLTRKSILSPAGWHGWYAASLAAAVWVTAPSWGMYVLTYAIGIFLMRLRRSVDKYWLWSVWTLVLSTGKSYGTSISQQ